MFLLFVILSQLFVKICTKNFYYDTTYRSIIN